MAVYMEKKIFKELLAQHGFQLTEYMTGGDKYILINYTGKAYKNYFGLTYMSANFKTFNYQEFLTIFENRYASDSKGIFIYADEHQHKIMEIIRTDFPAAIRAHKINKLTK